jgi:metallo-beta-lactamase class B
MSARIAGVASLLAGTLAACSPLPATSTEPVAPSGPARSEPARTDLAAACGTRDGWSDPAPPAHVAANVWDVGTCGITVLLVTGDAGHVLIDAATAEAVPAILANIRSAGFDPRDVRWMVSSHEHHDHVGGMAALRAATGARIAAGRVAAAALERGQVGADDPQVTIHQPFAPVKVDKVLADGEALTLGNLRLALHETPVHSPGSVSWTWQSAGGGPSFNYIDSLTTISADDYRFADHPERVSEIRKGLAAATALPCGILLTPHPSASDMFERLAGRAPLEDSAACRVYADDAKARFESRLAKETAR